MSSVGIIGYGSFGSFLARKLNGLVDLHVYEVDPRTVPAELNSSLQDVCSCDYLILAVPITAYDELLPRLSELLGISTVIVDISSVKTLPLQKLKEHLPGRKAVITHPLFGPQSAEESFEGHTVVMCPSVSDQESYERIKKFVLGLGLSVNEKTPEEHDKEMALAQGLTFYLARALLRSQIHDVGLRTPSFNKLLDLAELESHHSEELFRTIQLGNPYTAEIRQKFIDIAIELNAELS